MGKVGLLNRGKSSRASEGSALLLEHGWLGRMPEDFQQAILGAIVWYVADQGTCFIHAGDDKGGMFGIARGTAEVSLLTGHPDTPSIHIARTGFWAGYRPLIGRSRSLSLLARTPVLWALVPQAALARLLAETPCWWRHILDLSEDNAEVISSGLADLTLQDSRQRAIAVLLRLAGCRIADPPSGEEIDVRLSQSELAAMAVMSRNTLNTVMGYLLEAGLVDVGYRRIVIRNAAAMRNMLEL